MRRRRWDHSCSARARRAAWRRARRSRRRPTMPSATRGSDRERGGSHAHGSGPSSNSESLRAPECAWRPARGPVLGLHIGRDPRQRAGCRRARRFAIVGTASGRATRGGQIDPAGIAEAVDVALGHEPVGVARLSESSLMAAGARAVRGIRSVRSRGAEHERGEEERADEQLGGVAQQAVNRQAKRLLYSARRRSAETTTTRVIDDSEPVQQLDGPGRCSLRSPCRGRRARRRPASGWPRRAARRSPRRHPASVSPTCPARGRDAEEHGERDEHEGGEDHVEHRERDVHSVEAPASVPRGHVRPLAINASATVEATSRAASALSGRRPRSMSGASTSSVTARTPRRPSGTAPKTTARPAPSASPEARAPAHGTGACATPSTRPGSRLPPAWRR